MNRMVHLFVRIVDLHWAKILSTARICDNNTGQIMPNTQYEMHTRNRFRANQNSRIRIEIYVCNRRLVVKPSQQWHILNRLSVLF